MRPGEDDQGADEAPQQKCYGMLKNAVLTVHLFVQRIREDHVDVLQAFQNQADHNGHGSHAPAPQDRRALPKALKPHGNAMVGVGVRGPEGAYAGVIADGVQGVPLLGAMGGSAQVEPGEEPPGFPVGQVRLAQVQGIPGYANLGDAGAARRNLDRALRILAA